MAIRFDSVSPIDNGDFFADNQDVTDELSVAGKTPACSSSNTLIHQPTQCTAMSSLDQQQCQACHADAPAVTDAQRSELHPQVPEWKQVEEDGVEKLQRQFDFKNFAQALAFTNQVGELAEQEGHHPALLTEYGQVTVVWWTHKISGLHYNDFICAAKTDQIFQG